MKNVPIALLVLILCTSGFPGENFQSYDNGKIQLKAGYILEGKFLPMQDSTVSIMLPIGLKTYRMEDVVTIHVGDKPKLFNSVGAIVGAAAIMIPLLIIGGDFIDYFGSTLLLSGLGGSAVGFATPMLLRSVGRDGIKWKLIYSV